MKFVGNTLEVASPDTDLQLAPHGDGKLFMDKTDVQNVGIEGNTIRSKDGHLVVTPHGDGKVRLGNVVQMDQLAVNANAIENVVGKDINLVPHGDGKVQLSKTVVGELTITNDQLFNSGTAFLCVFLPSSVCLKLTLFWGNFQIRFDKLL